jgi:hypothetical protein
MRAETGLEDVRIHDLRHTFASLLVSPSDYRRCAFSRLGLWMPATTGTPGSERAAQGRPEPFLIAPGPLPARAATGNWVNDPTHGQQFKARSLGTHLALEPFG